MSFFLWENNRDPSFYCSLIRSAWFVLPSSKAFIVLGMSVTLAIEGFHCSWHTSDPQYQDCYAFDLVYALLFFFLSWIYTGHLYFFDDAEKILVSWSIAETEKGREGYWSISNVFSVEKILIRLVFYYLFVIYLRFFFLDILCSLLYLF